MGDFGGPRIYLLDNKVHSPELVDLDPQEVRTVNCNVHNLHLAFRTEHLCPQIATAMAVRRRRRGAALYSNLSPHISSMMVQRRVHLFSKELMVSLHCSLLIHYSIIFKRFKKISLVS